MKNFKYFSITAVVIVLLGLLVIRDGFFTVNPGNVTIKIRLGKLVAAYDEGFYFKIPFLEKVKTFSIKIKRSDIKSESFSRDLQPIDLDVVINYRIEKKTVESIYRNLGIDYEKTIIDPITQEEVKSVISKYSAEEVIINRSEITKTMSTKVKERLLEKQIIVTDLSVTNFDFSETFLKSIEEKQIAEQRAKKAKNDVETVKREAEQTIEKAKAQAQALQLQKSAVSKELIELRKVEAQLKAIEKWDGKLPQYNGSGAVPFVNINK